jgi:hypothetical protein
MIAASHRSPAQKLCVSKSVGTAWVRGFVVTTPPTTSLSRTFRVKKVVVKVLVEALHRFWSVAENRKTASASVGTYPRTHAHTFDPRHPSHTHPEAQLLAEPRAGIVAVRDGTTIYTGVTEPTDNCTANVARRTFDGDTDTTTSSGHSDGGSNDPPPHRPRSSHTTRQRA